MSSHGRIVDRSGSLEFRDRTVQIWSMTHKSSTPSSRGRPREFDPDVVIERAMNVFWSNGYHGTSMADLLKATKLSRGSLYAAFGDKHGLFLYALERYSEESLKRFDNELDPRHDAVAGLRTCLAGYVTRHTGANGKRGCLVVATAMELVSHDAEVERRIGRVLRCCRGEARSRADPRRCRGASGRWRRSQGRGACPAQHGRRHSRHRQGRDRPRRLADDGGRASQPIHEVGAPCPYVPSRAPNYGPIGL